MTTASLISVISAGSDIATDLNDSSVKLTDLLNGISTKCKPDRQTNPPDLLNSTSETTPTNLLGSRVFFFFPGLKFRQGKLGQSVSVLLKTPIYKAQDNKD